MPAQTNIRTTRLEMIRTKARIKTASKGLELLKMKRASLVLEFFSLAEQIESLMTGMKDSVKRAMDSTVMAEFSVGRINLERIAAEQAEIIMGVDAKNVMGVKMPRLEVQTNSSKNSGGRIYDIISLPTSIDDAKHSYATLFKLMIDVAERENSLRMLLYEIEKLNRRANAIENVVVPSLAYKVGYIRQRLEDLERDQIVSIKFMKRKMLNAE
ncbi:MAG: V-type ATP synthase subunit D [Candidatus Marsarchaeota archaeon]|nr:V-type ATP synthase subunit D [Candidatus Marsarchaeota archaeon]